MSPEDGFQSYCVHYEWTVSTDDHTRGELGRTTIDHAITTGHGIDSRPIEIGVDEGGSPSTRPE